MNLLKGLKLRLKHSLREFLGVDNYLMDLHTIRSELGRVHRAIKESTDSCILGVDLGYKDSSQVIIIRHDRRTNAFQVVADTSYKFGSYQEFVREMRMLTKKYSVEIMPIDVGAGTSAEILRSKILPDKQILDAMDSDNQRFLKERREREPRLCQVSDYDALNFLQTGEERWLKK